MKPPRQRVTAALLYPHYTLILYAYYHMQGAYPLANASRTPHSVLTSIRIITLVVMSARVVTAIIELRHLHGLRCATFAWWHAVAGMLLCALCGILAVWHTPCQINDIA